tara:strand:+ start:107 stop:301 length:195 start_codon:yes stop_codon:yes gene_type:complete
MRYATITKLEDGEKVFGSKTAGRYHIQEWDKDGLLLSGTFLGSYEQAKNYAHAMRLDVREDFDE